MINDFLFRRDKQKADNVRHPCIMVMDSLTAGTTVAQRHGTTSILREYLKNEWMEKKGESIKVFDRTTIKGFYPNLPQQDNWWDCGIYLLQYAELFLKNPPRHVSSTFI